MNIWQKVAIGATLLALAVFLFAGGHRKPDGGYVAKPGVKQRPSGLRPDEVEWVSWTVMDERRTLIDAAGIVLTGGAVMTFLGFIKRKRPAGEDVTKGKAS